MVNRQLQGTFIGHGIRRDIDRRINGFCQRIRSGDFEIHFIDLLISAICFFVFILRSIRFSPACVRLNERKFMVLSIMSGWKQRLHVDLSPTVPLFVPVASVSCLQHTKSTRETNPGLWFGRWKRH